ncbi:hypothetical protein [Novosphingobium huizhouense]|uniref:hypothetical protein n=1 Tax=Novosphingobium huizhouense TaxID=2866625 RepID=UPI001CD85EE7|nr:hypothetical protein [Novosphingobium huizhouense]
MASLPHDAAGAAPPSSVVICHLDSARFIGEAPAGVPARNVVDREPIPAGYGFPEASPVVCRARAARRPRAAV